MTTPTPTTATVTTIDIPMGPGRQTLRVTLTRDAKGTPEALVLACGFGGGSTGDPFLRPAWAGMPIQLPADALAPLVQALTALKEGP